MRAGLVRISLAAAVLVAWNTGVAHATFPGGNGKIAFDRSVQTSQGYSTTHVFTANPDGSGATDLTPGDIFEFDAAWSADGRKLAAVGPGNIRTFTVGETARTQLTLGGCPAWSPDGTRIAFCRERQFFGPSDYEVWVMNADATGIVNLTNDPPDSGPYDADPSWSPDGERIAFFSLGRPSGIYTMRPDGTEVRLVVSGHRDFGPDWSPDGSKIAFMRFRFDGDDGEIYVVNADGTGLRQVTDNTTTDEKPVWSPDGTKIAFAREAFPHFQVWIADADGTGETLAISNARNPSWQPVNRAPDCTGVTATPSSLWPPNLRFRTVTLAGATDPDGDLLTLTVDGVTQDERVGPAPDARPGETDDQVRLRAERRGSGDGRVYRISFSVSDGTDGCSGVTTVEVRRHKHRPAIDSAPPSYDSFDQ